MDDSTSTQIPPSALAIEQARELLYREGIYLDERRWDEWIALFTEDCEYWVPTWRTESELSTDHERELSHIYYANRAGLEDRIVRIRSGRSPASTPLRRTTHLVSNVLLDVPDRKSDASVLSVRSSWNCHVFDPHRKSVQVFFGRAHYALRGDGSAWRIARKKTVIENDYFPSMLDVYCI